MNRVHWSYKPIAVEIETSHQCNILCNACAIKEDIKKGENKLPANEILNFLYQCKDQKIIGYSLTGGEPFLDFSLIKLIIQNSPIDLIKINTNGFIFSSPKKTTQILKELKEAGFGEKNKKMKPR